MLCSVLIPSRKRTTKLMRCVRSIVESTPDKNYEMLFRFDSDDLESIALGPELLQVANNAQIFIGPRLGYAALDLGYYSGLEERAQADFVWIVGDDMVAEGDWMIELRKVPKTGYIVQPATSTLGESTYPRAHAQAFPIFPRFCWKQFANEFPRPFDTAGDALLKRHGWQTWFLEGVTLHHDEATPRELSHHRL